MAKFNFRIRQSTHRKLAITIALGSAAVAAMILFVFFTYPLWLIVAASIILGGTLGGVYYFLSWCFSNKEISVKHLISESSQLPIVYEYLEEGETCTFDNINTPFWTQAVEHVLSTERIRKVIINTLGEESESLRERIRHDCARLGITELHIMGTPINLQNLEAKADALAIVALGNEKKSSSAQAHQKTESNTNSWFSKIWRFFSNPFKNQESKNSSVSAVSSSIPVLEKPWPIGYRQRERAFSSRPPNWFGVLGLPLGANPESIKKAFNFFSLEFHPDKQLRKYDSVTVLYPDTRENYQDQLSKWKQDYHSPSVEHFLFIFSPDNVWEVYWLKELSEEAEGIAIPNESVFEEEVRAINSDNLAYYDKTALQALLDNHGHELFDDYISLKDRNRAQFEWVVEAGHKLLPEDVDVKNWAKKWERYNWRPNVSSNQRALLEQVIEINKKEILAIRQERLEMEEELKEQRRIQELEEREKQDTAEISNPDQVWTDSKSDTDNPNGFFSHNGDNDTRNCSIYPILLPTNQNNQNIEADNFTL